MPYHDNKRRAVYNNTSPTLTDQASGPSTNINVILGQFQITGRVPGAPGEPQYLDTTQLPTDLRGFIHAARKANRLRSELPEQLRDLPLDKLMALTNEDIGKILTPPATPPDTKTEDKKEDS
jgi:hypothetical protein